MQDDHFATGRTDRIVASPKQRIGHLALLMLALLWASAAGAEVSREHTPQLAGARLVLADGHVVEFDNNGGIADKPPVRLDLGDEVTSIHSVVVDDAFDRIYVTPESSYARRATRVFHKSTLELLSLLPTITRVVIPRQPDVAEFAAFRSDSASDSPSYAGLQELHENGTTRVQLRSRSSFAQVLAPSSDWRVSWARFECRASGGNGFHHAQLGRVVSSTLEFQEDPRSQPVELTGGRVIGCWPDGSVWAGMEREPRTSTPQLGEIVVLDGRLKLRARIPVGSGYPFDSVVSIELGREPGGLAIFHATKSAAQDAIGTLFDLSGGSEIELELPAWRSLRSQGYWPAPAGLDQKRERAYLVPTRYLSGGLRLKRADRIFVLGKSQPAPIMELRLPQSLSRIAQENELRLDLSLDDEERTRRLTALGPSHPQLLGIREVQIVHVLR